LGSVPRLSSSFTSGDKESGPGLIVVRDPTLHQELVRVTSKTPMRLLGFSPDDSYMAVADESGRLYVWDVPKNRRAWVLNPTVM
jgi:hypothetical protein